MSFVYTVGKVEEFEVYPEGKYSGKISSLRMEKYGLKLKIDILSPAEHEGKKYFQDFKIYSEYEDSQKKARNALNKFAQVVGELKPDDNLTESDVIDRHVNFWIQHTVFENKTYMKAVGWELVKDGSLGLPGSSAYQSPVYPTDHDVPPFM